MHTETVIPELEAILETAEKTAITPPIQQTIRQYYRRFAEKRSLDKLVDWINGEYGTELTKKQIQNWHNIHGGEK